MITLEADNLKVDLEAVEYIPNTCDWCGLDLHIYGSGIDIFVKEDDCLLTVELEKVVKYLGLMLSDRLKKTKQINCLEPNFVFLVSPSESCLYIVINILNNGFISLNYLTVCLERKECKRLYDYLTQSVGVTSDIDNGECSAEKKTYRYVKVVYDVDSIREYSYLDENRIADYDTYVWVPVGSDNKERLAYVVDIGEYTADNVPYPLEKTKNILRVATEKEVSKIEAE